MPSSGSGTGTPVSGGAPSTLAAVAPTPYTLLSLERYRQLLGINPAFFWQAKGETYFPLVNQCDDMFYQFYWQNEQNVSREEIANAIVEAEADIAHVLGFSPAPAWVEEVYNYPRHHRRDAWEWSAFNKSIQLNQGKFIQGGQRAITLIDDSVTVTYSDMDGDGYKETAAVVATTSLTDACELKCYFAGMLGAPEWEVRTPRKVTISGGTVTFTYWAWQLIDPELQQPLTVTGQSEPIDVEATASYVTTVDVYREYNDFTATSAQLLWEQGLGLPGYCCSSCGGSGCVACELITQNGCIHVKNAEGTFVVPSPGTYDSDAGQWQYSATTTVCRNPDMVKVWYKAGELDQAYLAGRTCEPLSQRLAQAIAWLATARVNRPFCTCNNSQTFPGPNSLQRDTVFESNRELGAFRISQQDLENPFGTKVGEIKAWKMISRLTDKSMMGIAV